MSKAPPAPQFADPLPIAPSPEVLTYLARRRSASALALTGPGPDSGQLDDLLRLAARVPDHGKLAPWRFIILAGDAKAAFVAGLEVIAAKSTDPVKLTAKLAKVKTPPMGVAVISSPVEGDIPEWEQLLSAGAVCTNLLHAATAMGFGANWITDWYAYDPGATALLGLSDREKVAGFVFIGTAAEPPAERVRPDIAALTTVWSPDQPRPR